jgi:hypothetical protein
MSNTLEHSEAAGNLLSMDRLTKLRRAETQEEIDAGNWFFGEFLECVAGKRGFGKAEVLPESFNCSWQRDQWGTGDSVWWSICSANFGELYRKWLLRYQEACSSAAGRRRSSTDKNKRIDGKYTASINGHTEFGGWNKRGIRKFNYYCRLVEQDRLSGLAATAEADFFTYISDTERGKAILAKQTRRCRGSSGQPEEEEEEEDHQLTTRAYMESW